MAHPWIGEQHLLDLTGVNFLATTVDHVVGTAGQEEIAVRVEATDVTGVEPAVVRESVVAGAVGVGTDHPGAADLYVSGYTGRARGTVVVDDADLAADRYAH